MAQSALHRRAKVFSISKGALTAINSSKDAGDMLEKLKYVAVYLLHMCPQPGRFPPRVQANNILIHGKCIGYFGDNFDEPIKKSRETFCKLELLSAVKRSRQEEYEVVPEEQIVKAPRQ